MYIQINKIKGINLPSIACTISSSPLANEDLHRPKSKSCGLIPLSVAAPFNAETYILTFV